MMKKRAGQQQKPVNHMPVQSSSVRSIGYDKESNELHVTYNTGGSYVYEGVPEYVYQSLMMSSSKGSFLHNNIKNAYSFTKL